MGQGILALAEALPLQVTVQRRRLRSVLQDIMYLACKYVQRSHQHFLKFNRTCPWLRAVEAVGSALIIGSAEKVRLDTGHSAYQHTRRRHGA